MISISFTMILTINATQVLILIQIASPVLREASAQIAMGLKSNMMVNHVLQPLLSVLQFQIMINRYVICAIQLIFGM